MIGCPYDSRKKISMLAVNCDLREFTKRFSIGVCCSIVILQLRENPCK